MISSMRSASGFSPQPHISRSSRSFSASLHAFAPLPPAVMMVAAIFSANKRVERTGVWGFRLVVVIFTSGVIAVAHPQR
jgi:hypothetical protein